MGLHAAMIQLSPLIHEGEQWYKPYIVGDPLMVSLSVTPPLKNPGYAPVAYALFIGLAIKLPEIERSMWGRIKMYKNTRSEEHYSQILQSLSKFRVTKLE